VRSTPSFINPHGTRNNKPSKGRSEETEEKKKRDHSGREKRVK
jgi:hypothetical protein